MLSHWPIRNKLILGFLLLLVIVALLSWSGFHGLYDYRGLLKNLDRLAELPLATKLNQRVSDLRVVVSSRPVELRVLAGHSREGSITQQLAQSEFRQKLEDVGELLDNYRQRLQHNESRNSLFSDSQREWAMVRRIETTLQRVDRASQKAGWIGDTRGVAAVDSDLDLLQSLVAGLPAQLQQGITDFPSEVRDRYQQRITLAWITSAATIVLLVLFVWHFYRSIFRPLRLLIKGSRKVAAGHFDYRIRLTTNDEMAELATAMNDMTARFQGIRDDLDRQVQLHTQEVVRSEQLASVGSLAAGVAHEINEPLKSIIASATALESRFDHPGEDRLEQRTAMLRDLANIHKKAFRCKEITDNLLDFSRKGDSAPSNVDLRELIRNVIDMVGHLGPGQSKSVRLVDGDPVIAPVDAQEMKQLVLNLMTNSLNRLQAGGTVTVELSAAGSRVELIVTDDGPGMTHDELRQVFEPCAFEQGALEPDVFEKGAGQRAGPGLSVSACIVQHHGGGIEAVSDGPGRGSQIRVWLPRHPHNQENENQHQAA